MTTERKFEKGQKIQAILDGTWYPGVVAGLLRSGKYKVNFDDGDTGQFEESEVKARRAPKPETKPAAKPTKAAAKSTKPAAKPAKAEPSAKDNPSATVGSTALKKMIAEVVAKQLASFRDELLTEIRSLISGMEEEEDEEEEEEEEEAPPPKKRGRRPAKPVEEEEEEDDEEEEEEDDDEDDEEEEDGDEEEDNDDDEW